MNRSGRVLVSVLAEDEAHQRFIYHYLRQRLSSHEVRSEVAPRGRGSAEQWIREQYAEKVNQYRTRAAQTALVVLIDADNNEASHRERQLQQVLEQAQMDRRSNEERIAHLIPKRHIETWILCLNGVDVNEQQDCKHHRNLDLDAQIKPAAIAFFEGSRPNAKPLAHWVDSLCAAIPEVRRLEKP